jgi:hypothetical protein
MMRIAASDAPPGGKPKMIVTGRLGAHVCAEAALA